MNRIEGAFGAVPRRAGRDIGLSRGHFAVLLELCDRRDHTTGAVRVSQSTLGSAVALGCQRVNAVIGDLVRWRYVRKLGPLQYAIVYPVGSTNNCRPGDDSSNTGSDRLPGDTQCRNRDDTNCRTRGDTVQRNQISISETLPLPCGTSGTEGEGEPGKQVGRGSGESGTGRGQPAIRFTSRWDPAARNAVNDLVGSEQAFIADFITAVSGTLNPPVDVDGASYVRQLAERLGGFAPTVVAALATDPVIKGRVRDMPAAAALEAAAKVLARTQAAAAATLPILPPGVEDDLPPPIAEALRLRRAFVEVWSLVNGREIDRAWLSDLHVDGLDAGGNVLRLSVELRYNASYIEGSLHGQMLTAARQLWPEVKRVCCSARSISRPGLARPLAEVRT